MILGLGMDVVEIARIQRMLDGPPARAARFLARCFTPAERTYCDGGRDRAARYAARFAAKEAASKALAVSGAPVSARETPLQPRPTETIRTTEATRIALGEAMRVPSSSLLFVALRAAARDGSGLAKLGRSPRDLCCWPSWSWDVTRPRSAERLPAGAGAGVRTKTTNGSMRAGWSRSTAPPRVCPSVRSAR